MKWFMKSITCFKPGYTTSITCSKIKHTPYNLIFAKKFNDSLVLILIISWDYLNFSLANECVGGITIPTQVCIINVAPGRSANQIAVFTSN